MNGATGMFVCGFCAGHGCEGCDDRGVVEDSEATDFDLVAEEDLLSDGFVEGPPPADPLADLLGEG